MRDCAVRIDGWFGVSSTFSRANAAVRAVPLLFLLAVAACRPDVPEAPIVIAHRGASGYLPEHTIAAYALAYGQGAQFIEPDVVLSADAVAFALHDITLERTTNVRDAFPGRSRDDGSFYVMDFTAAEIESLRVVERVPGRFAGGRFAVPRLTDVIDLVQGLNAVSGCRVGLYPELKNPAAHHEAGLDLASSVLATLRAAGFSNRTDAVYLQSFDSGELERVRRELDSDLTLIQLVGGRDAEAYAPEALERIVGYADGIGVFKGVAYQRGRAWVESARSLGLAVHLFTLREDRVFDGFDDFRAEVAAVRSLGVDGVFSDHPGATLEALGQPIDPVCGRR